MKPCAFTNQTLVDHSIGSLNYAKMVMTSSYIDVAKRRLEKFGIKVDDSLFELSVLLHDIGKAGEYYQEQFDDNCVGKLPSFIYHEIGSAIFFYDNIDDERVKKLIALAELNHLNAIRGISSLSEKKLPKGCDTRMLKLKRYGKVLLDTLRDKGFNIHFHVRDYTFDDYNKMLRDIANSNEPYLKLYVFFLTPIIVGDNLDSHFARGLGERRRFIEILKKEVGV
ncbi:MULTISPECIES: CRISPR-associated endonuclease Cas3'' [unclassified Stygiolobus]|uniref:CRISPR-associated endonuclease Cas3'' n=1 Tax=unclassified Stygiolobus TaxID=2824672 RepID=UPI00307D25A4